jgi:uncharacterized membrane protein
LLAQAKARPDETPPPEFPTPPATPPSTQLVRYLPYLGVILVTVGVITLAFLWRADPDLVLALLVGMGTMLYAGKEVGIPVGMTAGAPSILMGSYILLADVAFTCFAYPPMHYAIRSWMNKPGPIGAYLRHVRANAEKHRRFIARHRTWGLFLFMLIPFAINGPLVGALLGRLIGMRARTIIPTLILAIATTTIIWSTIYHVGFEYAERINPVYPKVFTASIVVIVIVSGILSLLRARRAHADEVVRAETPLTP